MKKTRRRTCEKTAKKKRGQKLWDTELPVVALVHRTPGDPALAVGRRLQRGRPRVGLLLVLHHNGVESFLNEKFYLLNTSDYIQ